MESLHHLGIQFPPKDWTKRKNMMELDYNPPRIHCIQVNQTAPLSTNHPPKNLLIRLKKFIYGLYYNTRVFKPNNIHFFKQNISFHK